MSKDGSSDFGAWARLQESLARGIVGGSADLLEVRIDVLLAELECLREIKRLYGTEIRLGPRIQERLGLMGQERRQREAAVATVPQNIDKLADELRNAGFQRELKAFQLHNLSRLTALPHGADFSVPGAGKTTCALANYAIQKARGRVCRLLVIAPLAAFAAWKEDAIACFESPPTVSVYVSSTGIPSTTEVLVTNYHRLASDYDLVRGWVASTPTMIVLDEAHRVKRGAGGHHGRAVLDLSFAAARRDVLTGTPAPQGAYDLVALMEFLYPGQAKQILPPNAFVEKIGRDPEVLQQTHFAVKRYFARTCKSDLGLPPTSMKVVNRPMGDIQSAIYQALVGRYIGSFSLETDARRQMRRLGRVVMYLLEAATNPTLLLAGSDQDDLPDFRHDPLAFEPHERISVLLARYAEFETPWKYLAVRDIVRDAARAGGKVLVWSNFVRNIRHLQSFLAEWNPAIVHGGVPPVDGASPSAPTTREAELNRFRHDDSCSVLLANPAACGEGVSLHHWCHHAVYLDRSFNAGHFLQSQDRIHRLGLAEGTETQFTLLVSGDSIDEAVDQRLRDKVSALARLLDDPGLVRVSLPSEEDSLDDDESVDAADSGALIAHLRRAAADVRQTN